MDDSSEEEWAVPSLPKRSKKENIDNCIIHCTDDSSPRLKIQSLNSWQTLLQANRVCEHHPLLDLSETLEQNQVPDIHCHRRCRSIFMLKKSLKALRKKTSLEKFHAVQEKSLLDQHFSMMHASFARKTQNTLGSPKKS